MKNSYFLITLIVVSLALAVFVYPQGANSIFRYFGISMSIPDKPFRLGLDLLGGTHLVYEADRSAVNSPVGGDGALSGGDWADAMQGVRDVVERRVNFFGVSEPLVQVSGSNRLIVELAGISDVNQAIELIGETPFLEFREETDQTRSILEAQGRGERLNEAPFVATGLNGRHLKRAQIVFDPQTGIPQVSLQLTDEGAKLFAEITKRNIGKLVAIYLDGAPISIPVVQNEIPDGQAVISGNFNPQEAKLLATRLNSGALPVPIKLISQQTVGASLGAESLAKSLKAGLYSLIFVAVFMIFLYRLPGVISIITLFIYILAVLAIYKLMPVTLTLAGIAGFILTLGMAVDANVLIFARMKEELASGKTVANSVREGFSRAWLSIRDSHITTLLSALVLYLFTTSIVKGFALTLGIGAILSLFTATVITRMLLGAIIGNWSEKNKWLFG
ncbi:MAG: protein-export membrane protein SecD [Candidatus Yanofskybacteria bacterium RIFCSPHIGHO2_01_FULL_43_42]|uniref:Protein translocase subunit SecD n=1 Tax=Candidatus Yanofskybacteria bacterium RIFCSPLOWO2_01_FULL_43_22 TaxID=1802695 RepID=A0A1F8GH25_9BACT|nr:MAG: protein-export membrane protein SecD [Candidatus Yanofskybacteria bacterium RIFCSPHIGHO2_01_FULL_43_42]OGN13186.1 MAG: protein-export membrane protein SecD [Candidatus Yanofskybacteria bacterium RIFCSPHIGHO2_02_FULL_43_17]OGN24601.1 MAG: protein-export membrane protein SecD [Candidatus Yanofskybacteria bacterium RIFCSPLOWO2_01_FULL_43_22]